MNELFVSTFQAELEKLAVTSKFISDRMSRSVLKAARRSTDPATKSSMAALGKRVRRSGRESVIDVSTKALKKGFSQAPGFTPELSASAAKQTRTLMKDNIKGIHKITKKPVITKVDSAKLRKAAFPGDR